MTAARGSGAPRRPRSTTQLERRLVAAGVLELVDPVPGDRDHARARGAGRSRSPAARPAARGSARRSRRRSGSRRRRAPSSRGAASSSTATGSMLNSHGENTRTWPHSRMLAPTASPASNTSGSRPRVEQVGRGGQADRAGADHGDGQGFCMVHVTLLETASKNFDAMRDRSADSPRHQVFSICLSVMTAAPRRPVLRPARRRRPQRRRGRRARARLQGARRPPPREDPQPPARRRRRGGLRLRLRGPARPQAVHRQLPPQAAARRRHRRAREARLLRLLLASPTARSSGSVASSAQRRERTEARRRPPHRLGANGGRLELVRPGCGVKFGPLEPNKLL